MLFSNPYTPYLIVSALIGLITAVITWTRRSAPGAFPLFLMLLTTVIWAGADAMLLETTDAGRKIFWFDVMIFGALMGTPAFWAFGVQFTNRGRLLTSRNLFLISAIPVLSVFLAWTTDDHGLFYAVRDLANKLPDGTWNLVPGAFYWVYILFSYAVVIYTIVIVVRQYVGSSRTYKGQSAAVLVGTLIPFLGNIVYNVVSGVNGVGMDPTPLLFTAMGVVYAYGLFWYRLFDLVPVARDALVEHMQDGVIVIDAQNRVVDVNPSALRWLKWDRPSPVGRDIRDLLRAWVDKFSNVPPEIYVETEVRSDTNPHFYFDLHVEPILDEKNMLTGRLIVFRDITRQKSVEQALRDSQDRLRLHLKEIEMLHDELREQVIRDPLTGLFNRRYLEETLERELARAAREGNSIGICMADIDRFKSFNDQHGHKAGDLVLQALADILLTYSRAEDVVCRYGGEEFLILLPGADLDVTARRAEDWRRAFEQAKIQFDDGSLSTTLSLGVAVYPRQGLKSDELLKAVDEALYDSKRNGRNQVSVAKSLGGNFHK